MTPTELEHLRLDCEARAAKGEVVKLDYFPDYHIEGRWHSGGNLFTIQITETEHGWGVSPFSPWFDSLLAAQLFAESLLREATRALWESEIERRIRAEMDMVVGWEGAYPKAGWDELVTRLRTCSAMAGYNEADQKCEAVLKSERAAMNAQLDNARDAALEEAAAKCYELVQQCERAAEMALTKRGEEKFKNQSDSAYRVWEAIKSLKSAKEGV